MLQTVSSMNMLHMFIVTGEAFWERVQFRLNEPQAYLLKKLKNCVKCLIFVSQAEVYRLKGVTPL